MMRRSKYKFPVNPNNQALFKGVRKTEASTFSCLDITFEKEVDDLRLDRDKRRIFVRKRLFFPTERKPEFYESSQRIMRLHFHHIAAVFNLTLIKSDNFNEFIDVNIPIINTRINSECYVKTIAYKYKHTHIPIVGNIPYVSMTDNLKYMDNEDKENTELFYSGKDI